MPRAKPNLTPEGIEKRRQGLLNYYATYGRSPAWSQHIAEAKRGKPSIEKGRSKPSSRYKRSDETKKRMSEGRKRMLKEHPEVIENLKLKLSGKGGRVVSQETKTKISRIKKQYYKEHPEAIEQLSDSRRGKKNKAFSRMVKQLWREGYFPNALIKGWNLRPNKQEIALGEIIEEVCPGEFKYNGDYSLGISLNRSIPDFVNVNGKKQAIEFFGTYWHNQDGRGEQDKIAKYKDVGWDCLVIWDTELGKTDALKEKIRAFVGGVMS